MAFSKNQIHDWVKALNLATWGPTEIYWTPEMHYVHVIVEDGHQESALQEIKAATEKELAAGTAAPEDVQDFLEHLTVTDYAQED